MRPSVPPSVVALLCEREGKHIAYPEQAAASGFTHRHFVRLIQGDWGDWNVRKAERWCAACGLDFWNLNQLTDKLRRIPWHHKMSRIRRALDGMIRLAGVQPTPEVRQKVAASLSAK